MTNCDLGIFGIVRYFANSIRLNRDSTNNFLTQKMIIESKTDTSS